RMHALEVVDASHLTAYDARARLLGQYASIVERVVFEHVPHRRGATFTPDDEYFGQQWNLPIIQATEAWDISLGRPEVVAAVLDSGCDLDHPDLAFASRGTNVGAAGGGGGPTRLADGSLDPHGTYVAGVIAAATNNTQGVSGIAGGCRVLPIATPTISDAEVA